MGNRKRDCKMICLNSKMNFGTKIIVKFHREMLK